MSVAVPAALGLPVLLVFNAIMLTSAGSTLDSTFASAAKLAGAWPGKRRAERGREALRAARDGGDRLLGNCRSCHLHGQRGRPGDHRRHDHRGTMVMGLAPIFLLSFVPGAGRASFHLRSGRPRAGRAGDHRGRVRASSSSRAGSTSAPGLTPTTSASTSGASCCAPRATSPARRSTASSTPADKSVHAFSEFRHDLFFEPRVDCAATGGCAGSGAAPEMSGRKSRHALPSPPMLRPPRAQVIGGRMSPPAA